MSRFLGLYLRGLPVGIAWCSGFGLAFAQSISLSNDSDSKTHIQSCTIGTTGGAFVGVIYPVSIPFIIWFAVFAPDMAKTYKIKS